MRSGRTSAVTRGPGAVSRSRVARVRHVGGQLGAPVDADLVGRPPDVVILFREVHAAVVPRVAVGVEAPGGLDGDERRLGDIARALEEVAVGCRAVLPAVEEGRDGRHAARLPEPVEYGAPLSGDLVSESRLDGRVGRDRSGSVLKESRVEVLERVLERVRLGSQDRPLDDVDLDARSGELGLEEIEGVPEAAGVVASELPQQGDGRGAIFAALVGVLMNDNVNLVLRLELGQQLLAEFRGLEELEELGRASEDEFVIVGDHALEKN